MELHFLKFPEKTNLPGIPKCLVYFLLGISIPLAFPPKNSQIEWLVFLEIQQFLDFFKNFHRKLSYYFVSISKFSIFG